MRFTNSIGMICLCVYLILSGISTFVALGIPAAVFGVLAIVAGVLLLIGR